MTDIQARVFTTADFLEDFDYLWRTFAAEYAYFDEKTPIGEKSDNTIERRLSLPAREGRSSPSWSVFSKN